jgi:hypothetical protein
MWSLQYSFVAAVYLALDLASAFTNPVKTLNGSDPQLTYHDGK